MVSLRDSGAAWLFVKVSAFTLVIPGTVVGWLPHFLLIDSSIGDIDFLGMSLLGILPIVFGAALYLRSAFDFAFTGGGTPAPIDAPVSLVTTGPYRYSRNPMYVGILSILAGEALLYDNLSVLYFMTVMFVIFNTFIMAYEERVLRQKFGETFVGYCKSVPRWLPKWRGFVELYQGSFLKVGAYVLAGGVVVHILRLTVGVPLLEMPTSAHAFLVVLPSYAVMGMIFYWRRIDLGGWVRPIVFSLIIALLLITVVMHVYSIVAHDNTWYRIFPMWYSVFSIFAYGGFAFFLKTRSFREDQAGRIAPG